jgi:hypothetical protein
MSGKNVLDYQRDYEQLLFRRRQLELQQHQVSDIPITHPSPVAVPAVVNQFGQPQIQDKALIRYNNKLSRKDYIPSVKCRDMILDWCRLQFKTSRIVASKCYRQALEYLESGCRKKEVIMGNNGLRDKLNLSKEDCARFWGIEMEFKVKQIFSDCFHLVIDECETFHHSKDRTVVAKPDGFVKFGLKLTHMPNNLETSFEIKGQDASNWLAYETKAPISGHVPARVKKEYFLQCMMEMACTGCKATFYTVWSPYCVAAWIIYWDQAFWDKILKPLYFEAKINFDLDSVDSKPEELTFKFDEAIRSAMETNCQRVFLAQKLSQNSDWRFESCPVDQGQPEFDLSKVTTVPMITINCPNDRLVIWEKTPDLKQFINIQKTVFMNK